MAYSKKELRNIDKDGLLQVIDDLQLKLKKRNTELHRARTRLKVARSKMLKMKDTVAYQRRRILELYPDQVPIAAS